MSKWFASAQDLSDSESSDSSDEDQQQKKTTTAAATAAATTTGPTGAAKKAPSGGVSQTTSQARSKFMKNFGDDSDSAEEERVVVSGVDKKKEALNQLFADLKNHLNINDFGSIMTDFERLAEDIQKSADGINSAVELLPGDVLPNSVIRAFAKIENAINETQAATKEKKLTLSKQNSVSFNKLKQKLKKYLSSTGPTDNNYEKQLAKFREAPVWSEDERAAAAQKEGKKPIQKKAVVEESDEEDEESEEEASEEEEDSEEEKSENDEDDEDEDDDDDKSQSEDEESEEEELNIFTMPREQLTPAQRRLLWVKVERLPLYLQELLNKKKKKKKVVESGSEAESDASKEDKPPVVAPVGTPEDLGDKETVLNLKDDFQIDYTKSENIYQKLKDIQQERMKGKKYAAHHAKVLTHVLDFSKDPRQRVEILLNLLSSIFSSAKTATPQGYLTRDAWNNALTHVQTLIGHLSDPALLQKLLSKKTLTGGEEDGEVSAQLDFEKSILPSLVSFLQNLDSELLKAFQGIGFTKFDYLLRLRDENKFLFLIDSVSDFISAHFPLEKSKIARIAILKLDHLYYKNDSIYTKFTSPDAYVPKKPSVEVIRDLVTLINASVTSKMRVRAALCQAYHHGIHRRFYEAKELLLKTHVGDSIHLQDISNQILYNRAITQIGLAAFRLGLIEEAHEVLVEIVQSPRLREILAQGVSRMPDKPAELEKEELKRQVPYHMHINLQQLDCIYMMSAMLLEVPNIAENQFTVNKKVISKNFKKLLEIYDAKAFQLAPEGYRDQIVYAAKQLNKSNWQAALDHIFSIRLLQKMPEFADDSFRNQLTLRFKECALKAFLCRAARTYESFSVEGLTQNFELSSQQLMPTVNRMILKGRIHAHLADGGALIVMDEERKVSSEAKELQQLSLQYSDKLESMIDNNERLIDMLAGGSLYSLYAKEKAQQQAEKAQAASERQAHREANQKDGGVIQDGGFQSAPGGRGGENRRGKSGHSRGGASGHTSKRGGRGGASHQGNDQPPPTAPQGGNAWKDEPATQQL